MACCEMCTQQLCTELWQEQQQAGPPAVCQTAHCRCSPAQQSNLEPNRFYLVTHCNLFQLIDFLALCTNVLQPAAPLLAGVLQGVGRPVPGQAPGLGEGQQRVRHGVVRVACTTVRDCTDQQRLPSEV